MIPDGKLLRSRVITTLSPALEDVLDRRLDGYALLSPRDALLGTESDRGVVTFEAGVATLAYHAGTDRGGPPALEDIGAPPYRFELYALEADALELPHRAETLRIPPGSLAERLADDDDLADRVREFAGGGGRTDLDDLEAFLDDESAISALREDARENALERADEWGFEEALDN